MAEQDFGFIKSLSTCPSFGLRGHHKPDLTHQGGNKNLTEYENLPHP